MKKVCPEYFPYSTTSAFPSCDNCKYGRVYTGCQNVNVQVALSRKAKEIDNNN